MASKHIRSSAPFTRARPSSATAGTADQCISLTDKTCDLVAELSIAFKAYLALERFVSPEYEDEAQAGVPSSRAELGSMLNALNDKILRLIGALADTTTVLQAEINTGGTQAR